jgi:hypothetical protein
MRERGPDVGRPTASRWVQRYAPEINKRIRPHLKMSGTSHIATWQKISEALLRSKTIFASHPKFV